MNNFVITAALLKLGYAAFACVLMVGLLRFYDWSVKTPFSSSFAIMRQNPIALAIYKGLRILAVAILIGMVVGCAPARSGTLFPDRYDRQIARAVATYWPTYPFPLSWKAQLWQESRLDPAAVSPVGAAGLAQFMPATWAEVARQLRLPAGASPVQDIAIEAGAWYMANLRRQWSSPRPEDDRQRLAQASYNGGLGNILAAQRKCRNARHWPGISACLPDVTGTRSAETIGYVTAIARWRAMMEAGL